MKASINHPQGLAIDGSGHVWVTNYRGPSITELAGSAASSPGQILSPAAGYAGDAKLLEAYAIRVDASGNLWITNQGSSLLTEVVGLATPVKTPLIGLPQTP
jgi:streptogramin lyase